VKIFPFIYFFRLHQQYSKGEPEVSTQETREIVQRFIEEVWNKGNLAIIDELVDPGYIDHSMPLPGPDGLKKWIQATSAAFDHHTSIEDQATEEGLAALRISFRGTHRGEWRGITSQGKPVQTTGFRFYRVANGKIVEHWGYMDGVSMEQQLKAE